MSLILDALNRSDSERANPNSAPGLHTVHGAPGGQDKPFWRRALWPGLVLVLAIVAVLPWLGDRDPALPAASDSAPERSARAAEPLAPEPAASVYPAKETPASASTSVSEAPEAEVSVDVAALYESRSVEVVAPPTPASSPGASATLPTEPAMDAGAEDSPPVNVAALARAAEAALAERPAREPIVEHEAPFIAQLSQQVKDQIPSIFYSAHKWASDPSQRSVVLNGQERRAGQQVKPGLRLVDILKDSIVLDFRGTEFRLRSLNSWVNL